MKTRKVQVVLEVEIPVDMENGAGIRLTNGDVASDVEMCLALAGSEVLYSYYVTEAKSLSLPALATYRRD